MREKWIEVLLPEVCEIKDNLRKPINSKERWQIESVFKALKYSSFNLEDTHLTEAERVQKLFAQVVIAFTWTYIIDIKLDKINPIKIKKHGRRVKSLMKYDLNYITNILFCNDLIKLKECCEFLPCTQIIITNFGIQIHYQYFNISM